MQSCWHWDRGDGSEGCAAMHEPEARGRKKTKNERENPSAGKIQGRGVERRFEGEEGGTAL